MISLGMASKMSLGQSQEFGGAVLRCLPDLDVDVAQGWIDNPEVLRSALRVTLSPSISIGNLELVPFCKYKQRIDGEELAQRGRRDVDYLLEHQDEIPEEFRLHRLVFAGTRIQRDREARRYIACLVRGRDSGGWFLYFQSLGDEFRPDDRVVRPRREAL